MVWCGGVVCGEVWGGVREDVVWCGVVVWCVVRYGVG